MQISEIQTRLHAAMVLRIPMFDPSLAPGAKVAELEEYLRTTAYHRAECEQALHWAWEAQKSLREKWMDVAGWEAMAGRQPTQAQIDQAKRVIAPDLWAGLREADDLVRSLDRQIKRLALDDAATSRSYTLISGS